MLSKGSAQFSAGAIYVQDRSFNQSGGTLTITDASSESDGGVVRMRIEIHSYLQCFRGAAFQRAKKVTSWIFLEKP